MSSVNWTPDQLQAIEASGKAVYVSAAAGSGKTAVLVEKLSRMLADPAKNISADSIVVVTFTNDAAAQMKSKLEKNLTALLTQKTEEFETADEADRPALQAQVDHISSQLTLIPSANISTIHSFCFGLIRDNADQAGVDPAFSVIDRENEKTVIGNAMKHTLNNWAKVRSDDISCLFDFFTPETKSFNGLMNLLPDLRDKVLALAFPSAFMKRCADYYAENPKFDDEGKLIPEGIIGEYLSVIKADMDKALGIIRICREFIFKIDAPLPPPSGSAKQTKKAKDEETKLINKHNAKKAFLCELDNAEQLALELFNDPSVIFSKKPVFNPIDSKQINGTSPFGKVPFSENTTLLTYKAYKIYTPMREKYTSLLGKYIKIDPGSADAPPYAFSLDEIKADFKVHARICSLLADLLNDIFDEERRIKDERHVLGFSDAEQIVCSLLCSLDENGVPVQSELAKRLSEQYSIVMIDEFQDSTGIQELIFRMLSKGGSASCAGSDFFAVGDIKQSIYRFRCAEPKLFAHDLEESAPYKNDGDTKPSKILLKQNFRSSASVVGFVNTLFDAVMSEENGGVFYGPDERLVQGRQFSPAPPNTAVLNITDEFSKLAKQRRESSSDPKIKVLSADKVRAEADAVAMTIKNMLSEKDTAGNYLYKPSDFCILCRNSTHFELYADTLEAFGIPASHRAPPDLMLTPEITVMMSILRAADNPYNDTELACALMSPVFMFTADDMSRIHLMSALNDNLVDGKRMQGLYRELTLCAKADENKADEYKVNDISFLTSGLIMQCRDFTEKFGRLRSYRLTHTVSETVRYIYDCFDVIRILSMTENGSQKRANLNLFLSNAADFDKTDSGLSAFIRRCDNLIDNKIKVSSAVPSEQECVSIMTIHKSKGLQFPFVFLCDTNNSGSSTFPVLLFSSEYGTSFDITSVSSASGTSGQARELSSSLRYAALPSFTLRELQKRSENDEDIMLLYVALTRAENRLFITRQAGSDADERSEMFRLLMGLSDADFSGNTPSAKTVITVQGEDVNPVKYDLALCTAENISDMIDIALNKFPDRLGYEPERIECENIAYTAINKTAAASTADPSAQSAAAAKYTAQVKDSYDYALSKTASKLTVSEIAKDHDVNSFVQKAVKNAAKNSPVNSAAARGTAVHAFMELADFEMLNSSRNDLDAAVGKETDRLVEMGLMSRLQADCVDTDMIRTFINAPIFSRIMDKNVKNIWRERSFLVRISDLGLDDDDLKVYNNTDGMLQGTADLLFEEPDGLVLVDYKTDNTNSADVLTERYTRQLELYARVFSLILGKPVKEALIYSFTMGRTIDI